MSYRGVLVSYPALLSRLVRKVIWFVERVSLDAGSIWKMKMKMIPALISAFYFFFAGFTISDTESHLGQHNGDTKPKRMRTSFKHHQLRAMKAYFAMNHNPDAKDLKQLSQKTGLSKRVLQVWFQNARAKYRRTVCNPQAHDLSPDSQDQASPVSAILESGIV